jgi:predicted RNase H-like HicB family nuclease
MKKSKPNLKESVATYNKERASVKEIIFLIEEDPEGGYNAQALGESIFTQGETTEELKENIKDALRCHFDDINNIPKIIRLHFVREDILTYA